MKEGNYHFFAANAFEWKVSNNETSLLNLIDYFRKDKKAFGLYLVPLPHDAEYTIDLYVPQVKGTIKLIDIYECD